MTRRRITPEDIAHRLAKAERLEQIEYILERLDHRLAWAEANSMPHDLPWMVRTLVAYVKDQERA